MKTVKGLAQAIIDFKRHKRQAERSRLISKRPRFMIMDDLEADVPKVSKEVYSRWFGKEKPWEI